MNDKRLGQYFDFNGTKPEAKKPTTKDWSTDWLRIREKNLLESGTSLTSPYSQSYVVYRAI